MGLVKGLFRTRSRRWAGAARLVAALLLALICADLVADARCDVDAKAAVADSTLVAGGLDRGSDEPCVSFCVPDCFCCSRSVGAVADVAPPRPALAAVSTPPASPRWPLGVRPVAVPPPLLRG